MAIYKAFKITEDGIELENKAQTGKELKFTKFKLGDGRYDGDIRTLKDILSEKMQTKVTRLDIKGTSSSRKVLIGFDLNNSQLTEGFYLREIGLYATDPDTQEEKLAFYTNVGEDADYIAEKGSATVLEKLFNVELFISDVDNITAEIDSSLTYVSYKEYTEKMNDIDLDYAGIQSDIGDINDKLTGLSGAYVYRGSVRTRSELPKDNQKNGDVYNIEDTDMNVAWNGNDWDDLGTTFDPQYSALLGKPQINNVILEGNKTFEQLGMEKEYKPRYIQNYTLDVRYWMQDVRVDGQWSYPIGVNGVTANHKADIFMDLDNQEKLISGSTYTDNGHVYIVTRDKPDENVVVNIEITLVKGETV